MGRLSVQHERILDQITPNGETKLQRSGVPVFVQAISGPPHVPDFPFLPLLRI